MKCLTKNRWAVRLTLLCVTASLLFTQAQALDRPYRYNPQNDVLRYYVPKNDEKIIALTFDDGPHPTYTERVLQVLADHDAKATFFEVGMNAEYYPAVTKEILAQGHEIGNHTYSHPDLSKLSQSEIEKEIQKQSKVIEEITGAPPLYFRPPCGSCRDKIIQSAEQHSLTVILWSIDTRDWAGNDAAHIAEDVINSARPGDIILFHDYPVHASQQTVEALERILPALTAEGFRFVTISELLSK